MRLGALLLDRGDQAGAEAHLRKTLELGADTPEAGYGLAQILLHRSAYVEAEHYARLALVQRADRAEFHHLLGLIMTEAGDWDAAIIAFTDAVARDRRYVSDLATVYFLNGRSEKAVALYRQAIAEDPEFAIPHYNLGQVLLRRGEFEEGWIEYEWRWRLAKFTSPKRNFTEPEWRGEPLNGRTLLVNFEQGAGDVIQFARYIHLLPKDGRIIFEVQPSLCALFEGFAHVDEVVASGTKLPAFDCQITLLNLPRYIQPDPASLPAPMPYLTSDPARRKAWKKKLDARPGLKVGVVWTGGRATPADIRRSVPAAQIAELGPIEGVTFVSLQKAEAGLPEESTEDFADRPDFVNWMGDVTSFADTAALIDCLDLVLGVDTAVIHLAGALGRPVWLANRFDSCWRWGERAGESAWYPTLQEFRQNRPGDWAGVFADIRKALGRFAAGKKTR
jgi:Tfp pilus assembly protein PilF